ncbi:MAG: DNA-directed RNA polymerase, subunit E'' [Nanoarchaeota archaeon]|nr:DNA-directed RNA polymerase, subunit E'' [Nanoarchaeota archaeon]MBU1644166.1 DNA-directed RNA polymerase, subunit E'' [Nanoarchaeota archaeon]MBU1977529.1 DNA-directed RNA polymerase, subunit E'' [Nanoarchaeota archaeon]
MSKKKACRKCKLFVEGDTCPACSSVNFTTSWQGRIYVTDVNNSEIAQKIGLKVKGEYAIKIR